MANKRHKNRLMKKYFWRLGCVEARIRSDARKADLPPALGLTAATATMRRTSN
jgi:hypothetical protein